MGSEGHMDGTLSLNARRRERNMSKTAQKLIATLTSKGQGFVSELLNLSSTEVSRKMLGESGFKVEQIAAIFDALDVQIVSPCENKVIVDRDHYKALTKLSSERLDDLNNTAA